MKPVASWIGRLLLVFFYSFSAGAGEPEGRRVIQDGLTRYTVLLQRDAVAATDAANEPPALNVRDPRNQHDLYAQHDPRTRVLVKQLERDFGVKAVSMTSRTAPRFTAFMSDSVAEALRQDRRVRAVGAALIGGTTYSSHSSAPRLWTDAQDGGEIVPWGKKAIGAEGVPSVADTGGINRQAAVYMIDDAAVMGRTFSGNQLLSYTTHADVDVWVAPIGAGYTDLFSNPSTTISPHGQHVAGILGARSNSAGIRGVWPGAQIINVIRGDTTDQIQSALASTLTDIEQNMPYQFAVVNISSNGTNWTKDPSDPTSFWDEVNDLRGKAFVVQSAGNQGTYACGLAWNAMGRVENLKPSADGVMIVGGIDYHGKSVGTGGEHVQYQNSYEQPSGGVYVETSYGTNINCVEAWAPSFEVYSTWNALGSDPHLLSGTSMAAPHVAAMAAFLCRPELMADPKPVTCEGLIRQRLFSWGQIDTAQYPIRMPSLTGPTTPIARLFNVSTRAKVVGWEPVTAGFVLEGTKTVAIAATGPSLAQYGVANPLSNPKITLIQNGVEIAVNDDWQSDAQQAALSASGFAPSNGLEAALLRTLPAGAYTVRVEGVGGGTGETVVAVYEAGQPEVRIRNLSTRAWVEPDFPIHAGFMATGPASGLQKAVALVVAGPSLSNFGVQNALADPWMSVVNAVTSAVVENNDNWESGVLEVPPIGYSEFRPDDAREPAVLRVFPQQPFTVVVRGVNGTSGVAVVGIYDY